MFQIVNNMLNKNEGALIWSLCFFLPSAAKEANRVLTPILVLTSLGFGCPSTVTYKGPCCRPNKETPPPD